MAYLCYVLESCRLGKFYLRNRQMTEVKIEELERKSVKDNEQSSQ